MAVTRRLQDIADLLAALLDAPFAQPKTWTGQLVARNAKRGEGPANRVPCPACEGSKQRRVRGVPQACDRCLSPKSGKPLGWIYVDLMIRSAWRRQVGSVEHGLSVQWKTVPCDVCVDGVTLSPRWRGENNRCLRCGGSARLELTMQQWRATRTVTYTLEPNGNRSSGDPVIDCMTLRTKAGSFDELLAALSELEAAWPALYRLTCKRYVLGLDLRDERLERLAREGGLEFLSARMPEQIRVPGGLRKRQREEAAA